jgi:hypothetical protein
MSPAQLVSQRRRILFEAVSSRRFANTAHFRYLGSKRDKKSLSRSPFSATLLLATLAALELEGIRLEDL